MKIVLTEFITGNYMTFPMLPEEITVECGTRFQSYDIMNIGEIKLPLGEELTRFSWNCKLPGKHRQSENYVMVQHEPIKIQEWLSYLRNSNIKCRLVVTDSPINHTVYLESYTMNYSGGYGDYECDISFIQAKELKVVTEELMSVQTTKAIVPSEQQRPSKPIETQYTIKKGDCLWDIAQSKLGAGNRYMEIAELNGIKNPNKIQAGQVLLLPEKQTVGSA